MGLTEVAMVGEATAEATVVALGPEDPVPRAWTDMRVSFILNINRTLGYMLWFARFGLTRHVARLGRAACVWRLFWRASVRGTMIAHSTFACWFPFA